MLQRPGAEALVVLGAELEHSKIQVLLGTCRI